MAEPIVWQWSQIIYCGVLFLVGFALGHLTGMHEALNIVNKKNKPSGATPLHYAVDSWPQAVVKSLLNLVNISVFLLIIDK